MRGEGGSCAGLLGCGGRALGMGDVLWYQMSEYKRDYVERIEVCDIRSEKTKSWALDGRVRRAAGWPAPLDVVRRRRRKADRAPEAPLQR